MSQPERCLVHGRELHYDMRSGFDICYDCESEKRHTQPAPDAERERAEKWLVKARGSHRVQVAGGYDSTGRDCLYELDLAKICSDYAASQNAELRQRVEELERGLKAAADHLHYVGQEQAAHQARRVLEGSGKHE